MTAIERAIEALTKADAAGETGMEVTIDAMFIDACDASDMERVSAALDELEATGLLTWRKTPRESGHKTIQPASHPAADAVQAVIHAALEAR